MKAAATTFRANPKLDVEKAITELAVGEALVSFLDEKGRPTIVERAFVIPPGVAPRPDHAGGARARSIDALARRRALREGGRPRVGLREARRRAPARRSRRRRRATSGGLGGILDKLGLPGGGAAPEGAHARRRRWRPRPRARRARSAARSGGASSAACWARSSAASARGSTMAKTGRAQGADPADARGDARGPEGRAHHHGAARRAAGRLRGGALPPLRQQGADVRGPDRVHRADRLQPGQQDPGRGAGRA